MTTTNNNKDFSSLHNNYKFPIEIDYILDTIKKIESQIKISDQDLEDLKKLKEDDKEFAKFIEDKADLIKNDLENEGNTLKFPLEDAQTIHDRIIHINLILRTTTEKRASLDLEKREVLAAADAIIGELYWILSKIDVNENRLKIEETHGIIMSCTEIKQFATDIVELFRPDSITDLDESLESRLKSKSTTELINIFLKLIDPSQLVSYFDDREIINIVNQYITISGDKFFEKITPEIITKAIANIPKDKTEEIFQKIFMDIAKEDKGSFLVLKNLLDSIDPNNIKE